MLSHNSIRRADLHSGLTSPERNIPNASLEERFQNYLEKSYNVQSIASSTANDDLAGVKFTHAQEQTDADKDEYEFRLFAEPADLPNASQKHKVVLKSPTPPSVRPAFVKARRSDTYYFTGHLTEDAREQYLQALISGEQLIQGLNIQWVWPRSPVSLRIQCD